MQSYLSTRVTNFLILNIIFYAFLIFLFNKLHKLITDFCSNLEGNALISVQTMKMHKKSIQFQGGIGHTFGGISFFVRFRSFSCSDIIYKLVKVKSQSNTEILKVKIRNFCVETYFMKQNKAAILKPMPGFLK